MLSSTVANPSSLESNDGFRELRIQVMSVLHSKELSQGSKHRRWFLRGCVLLVESCEEQDELGIISLVPLCAFKGAPNGTQVMEVTDMMLPTIFPDHVPEPLLPPTHLNFSRCPLLLQVRQFPRYISFSSYRGHMCCLCSYFCLGVAATMVGCDLI